MGGTFHLLTHDIPKNIYAVIIYIKLNIGSIKVVNMELGSIFWGHVIIYNYFYIAFVLLFCNLTDLFTMNWDYGLIPR